MVNLITVVYFYGFLFMKGEPKKDKGGRARKNSEEKWWQQVNQTVNDLTEFKIYDKVDSFSFSQYLPALRNLELGNEEATEELLRALLARVEQCVTIFTKEKDKLPELQVTFDDFTRLGAFQELLGALIAYLKKRERERSNAEVDEVIVKSLDLYLVKQLNTYIWRLEAQKLLRGKIKPATIDDYWEWFKGYHQKGGQPTDYYTYQMPIKNWFVATSDFAISPLYGGDHIIIIVPPEIKFLGGKLGASRLYLMSDFTTQGEDHIYVPAYWDMRQKEM